MPTTLPATQIEPKEFVSVADVEEELGPVIHRHVATFPEETRETTIGKWIKRETIKFLESINLDEGAIVEEAVYIKVSDGILFAVCARVLRKAQANRKSGIPSPTYDSLINDYETKSTQIAFSLVERGFAVLKTTVFEIAVTTPTTITIGSTYVIEWTYTERTGNFVRIELWKAKAHYKEIVDKTPNDGKFSWEVKTEDVETGTDFQFKIVSLLDTLTYGMSDEFTLA